MSKLTIYLGLLCILCFPLNSPAATKNVTISWTMSDTSNVTGYRMYYAYDSTMSNKTLACATSDETVTSLTCPNVDLQSSPVYFEIAALTTEGELNSSPREQTFSSGISPVQGFQLVMGDTPPPPPSSISYSINFQPSSAPVPSGYQIDSGDVFATDRGYGWTTGPSSWGTRDRDNTNSPDQAYDTMIHVSPASSWEYALPNGTYRVTICMGDPSYPEGTENVQVEGIAVIDNATLSSSTPWIENTATVNVVDGRLTVTFTGSTDPARLCWLRIESAN